MDVIRINSAGNIVLTTGGALDDGRRPPIGEIIVRDDSLPCSEGDDCRCLNVQKTCGSNSTCNTHCDPSKAAFNLSACGGCDCPCHGRTSFPGCWGWVVAGTISRNQIPDNLHPGYYYKLLSSQSYFFNECTPEIFGSYSWGYFDPTGTQIGTSTGGQLSWAAGGYGIGLQINSYPTASFFGVNLQIQVYSLGTWSGPGFGGGGTDFGSGLNNGWVGAIGNGGYGYGMQVAVQLDPCIGGTATGSSDPNAYFGYNEDGTPIYGNQNPGAGAAPPKIQVKPKCRNCDGSVCIEGTTPASSCGSATLTMDVYQGMTEELDDMGNPVLDGDGNPVMIPVYVPFTGTFSGGCGSAASSNGMTFTIAQATGCTLVGSTDGEELNPTWSGLLATPIGNVDFGTFGADCPNVPDPGGEPGGATTIPYNGYPLIQDFNFTYGTDC